MHVAFFVSKRDLIFDLAQKSLITNVGKCLAGATSRRRSRPNRLREPRGKRRKCGRRRRRRKVDERGVKMGSLETRLELKT